MTDLLRLLVTSGVGPVSYLEMTWLALTGATTYLLAGELTDARAQYAVARDRIERWIAEGAVMVELKALLQQLAWGLIGLASAVTPPPPDVATEPARVLVALVFTFVLLAVQVTNLVFARWRRHNRRRITAALARQHATRAADTLRAAGATPMKGGRRGYDRLAEEEA